MQSDIENWLTKKDLKEILHGYDSKHPSDIDALESMDLIDSAIGNWVDKIDLDVKQMIKSTDDGDRANSLQNHGFAKHFILLCKMLPLWNTGISRFFRSSDPIESSPSPFNLKKAKKLHGKKLEIHDFLRRDIQLTDDSVNIALTKYICSSHGTAEENSTNEHLTIEQVHQDHDTANITRDADNEDSNNLLTRIATNETNHEEYDSSEATYSCTEEQSIEEAFKELDTNENNCLACILGDGTGMQRCTLCNSFIHNLVGCSIPIGDNESSVRVCIECANKSAKKHKIQKGSDSIDISEPKKKKSKAGKNPSDSIGKPNQIGHLKNGSFLRTEYKINGKKIRLTNTCALDSIVQIIAAAFAYYPSYKAHVDYSKDLIFELAKLLASK